MKKPKEMSPMKKMMGAHKSVTISGSLRRVSNALKKAASTKISMPKAANRMMKPISAPSAIKTMKPFGTKEFGPKFRLDDKMMKPVDMDTAHTTPSFGGKVAAPTSARATVPAAPVAAPVAAPTKKLSAKALRRAAAAAAKAK